MTTLQLSVFGNSSWTWNNVRKQYYYHSFLIQQPDLNYRCEALKQEMKNNLKCVLLQCLTVRGIIYLLVFMLMLRHFLYEYKLFCTVARLFRSFVVGVIGL